MPTFIIIYDDNTVSYMPFVATIKTTFYKKARIVENIAKEKNVRGI